MKKQLLFLLLLSAVALQAIPKITLKKVRNQNDFEIEIFDSTLTTYATIPKKSTKDVNLNLQPGTPYNFARDHYGKADTLLFRQENSSLVFRLAEVLSTMVASATKIKAMQTVENIEDLESIDVEVTVGKDAGLSIKSK